MDGLEDKIVGKGKELEGKLTGDKAREAQGKAEGTKGTIKEKGQRLKEDLTR